MTSHRTPSLLLTIAITALLAFAFLGTRSLWDPDEGRYTNVALNMLESGDWLTPMRNAEVGHWTKPPLTYWLIAASVAVFGYNPWAARLPLALAFLCCTWVVWRIARRWWPGGENGAALIYATMLLPFGATPLVTTDFILSAILGVAVMAWIESHFDEANRSRGWILLMWVAFGLGFMTKGPPALLPLLVIVVASRLLPAPRAASVFHWRGILAFFAIALPWYAIVVTRTEGLLDFFLGRELVERMANPEFGRHGEWYGWLQVYAPTLLLGSLPWTGPLWRWLRSLGANLKNWKSAHGRESDAIGLILFLWVVLPLLVFCIARSRMPLYLLPLFTPLALIVARQRHLEGRAFPALRWVGVWVAVLVGMRLATAYWPTHKDAAQWAEAIRERAPFAPAEVVFIEDMARYGLHLYLGAQIDKVSLHPEFSTRFDGEYDSDLAHQLARGERPTVFVCKEERWLEIRDDIQARGFRVTAFGAPYEERVIFGIGPRP
jgi:4-amino-4-deoxy-L-arabinose transferase-like glycosyltransferase